MSEMCLKLTLPEEPEPGHVVELRYPNLGTHRTYWYVPEHDGWVHNAGPPDPTSERVKERIVGWGEVVGWCIRSGTELWLCPAAGKGMR